MTDAPRPQLLSATQTIDTTLGLADALRQALAFVERLLQAEQALAELTVHDYVEEIEADDSEGVVYLNHYVLKVHYLTEKGAVPPEVS